MSLLLAAALAVSAAHADVKILTAEKSRGDCVSGDIIELSVEVRADEAWTTTWEPPAEITDGFEPLSSGEGDEVELTCPPCPPGEDGLVYPFSVTVTGAESGDVDFGLVTIDFSCGEEDDKGCSVGAGAAAVAPALLALIGLVRRRRG